MHVRSYFRYQEKHPSLRLPIMNESTAGIRSHDMLRDMVKCSTVQDSNYAGSRYVPSTGGACQLKRWLRYLANRSFNRSGSSRLASLLLRPRFAWRLLLTSLIWFGMRTAWPAQNIHIDILHGFAQPIHFAARNAKVIPTFYTPWKGTFISNLTAILTSLNGFVSRRSDTWLQCTIVSATPLYHNFVTQSQSLRYMYIYVYIHTNTHTHA